MSDATRLSPQKNLRTRPYHNFSLWDTSFKVKPTFIFSPEIFAMLLWKKKKKEEAKKSWALHNILCLSVSGCFLLVSCERRQGRADIWQDRKEGVRGRRNPLEGGEATWQEVMEEEAGVGREQRRKRWLNKENTEARKKKRNSDKRARRWCICHFTWVRHSERGGRRSLHLGSRGGDEEVGCSLLTNV